MRPGLFLAASGHATALRPFVGVARGLPNIVVPPIPIRRVGLTVCGLVGFVRPGPFVAVFCAGGAAGVAVAVEDAAAEDTRGRRASPVCTGAGAAAGFCGSAETGCSVMLPATALSLAGDRLLSMVARTFEADVSASSSVMVRGSPASLVKLTVKYLVSVLRGNRAWADPRLYMQEHRDYATAFHPDPSS